MWEDALVTLRMLTQHPLYKAAAQVSIPTLRSSIGRLEDRRITIKPQFVIGEKVESPTTPTTRGQFEQLITGKTYVAMAKCSVGIFINKQGYGYITLSAREMIAKEIPDFDKKYEETVCKSQQQQAPTLSFDSLGF